MTSSVQSPFVNDERFKGYLDEHQILALRKLRNGKVLWGGVGTGKSRVAAAYYTVHEAPKDVYVITTARKRDSGDWPEEFYQLGIGPATGPSIDLRRGGVVVQQRKDNDQLREVAHGDAQTNSHGYPYVLTVDSWNNIGRYRDVKGAFFIFDEQRLVGSGEWTKNFLRISANNTWLLLSGTPGDTWMDYVPLFIANGFYKNRTEFKREHVVYNTFTKFPKVDRYINQGRLARQRSMLLVEMPFVRHTRRRHVEVPLRYDRELLNRVLKERWHVYEERPLNDIAEMFLVARKVVNSDPSRLEMVCELWEKHPRLIVFYNFNFELASLRSLRDYYGIETTESNRLNQKNLAKNGGLVVSQKPTGIETIKLAGSGGDSCTTNTLLLPNDVGLRAETTKLISRDGFTDISVNNTSLGKMRSGKKSSSEKEPENLEASSTRPNSKVYGDLEVSATTTSIAEWNGHKHEPVPTTDRWLYLCQYTAASEAWNCTTTDAMITYSWNYSWKIMEQAYGRIDRLNSPFTDLWYYGFTTDSFVDRAIERSLKAKETFNAAKYKRIFES